jgi:hypothetical protein
MVEEKKPALILTFSPGEKEQVAKPAWRRERAFISPAVGFSAPAANYPDGSRTGCK